MDRRIVLVKFRSGAKVPYFTNEELRRGDLVVIETNKKKFKVVTVSQTKEIPGQVRKKAVKWIAQKLELESYGRKKNE